MRYMNGTLTFFFFNNTATTEIYTLSLHDPLPISDDRARSGPSDHRTAVRDCLARAVSRQGIDRKSTRLNSSHTVISYAVFCLKKKKNNDSGRLCDTTNNQTYHILSERLYKTACRL